MSAALGEMCSILGRQQKSGTLPSDVIYAQLYDLAYDALDAWHRGNSWSGSMTPEDMRKGA